MWFPVYEYTLTSLCWPSFMGSRTPRYVYHVRELVVYPIADRCVFAAAQLRPPAQWISMHMIYWYIHSQHLVLMFVMYCRVTEAHLTSHCKLDSTAGQLSAISIHNILTLISCMYIIACCNMSTLCSNGRTWSAYMGKPGKIMDVHNEFPVAIWYPPPRYLESRYSAPYLCTSISIWLHDIAIRSLPSPTNQWFPPHIISFLWQPGYILWFHVLYLYRYRKPGQRIGLGLE